MVATEFVVVVFLAGFGLAAGLPTVLIPLFVAPKRRNPIKAQTFESGQVPQGESRIHLIMQYYGYLIMFVCFDVTVMFLLTWGVTFSQLGFTSILPMTAFVVAIIIPMAYALKMAVRPELW